MWYVNYISIKLLRKRAKKEVNNRTSTKKITRYSTAEVIRELKWHSNITSKKVMAPVLLPGKPHGRRSLVGCSPWGRWGIPRMGEPGGLPSMGSHRVGHD